MSITSVYIADGPYTKPDGSVRGAVDFTLSDGRVIRKTLRAESQSVWDALVLSIQSDVETAIAKSDAKAAAETDLEISDAPIGESNREQIAYAYLKKAYNLNDPYQAYLKFDKFNNYRIEQNWTITQVVNRLSSVGLTQDEWDLLLSAYNFLSDSARVAAMSEYQPIVSTWNARDKL